MDITMDIVILANFCGRLDGTGNNRFLYLANMLSEEHDVELIASDFHHGSKTLRGEAPKHFPYKVTLLHESGYPKNICLQRFFSHFVWGKEVEKYLKQRKKPDVIYCAVPSLTGPLAAAKYCKKNGIRFIIDIQDLWPEAFQMVFHMPVISDLVFTPFRLMANGIYRRADAICAVSRTYVDRALSVNKHCSDGTCVFLGTRLEYFDTNVRNHPVTDKPEGTLWLAYCGTLGASYDLTCVFDALALLKKKGMELPKFVVMGNGPRRTEFEQYAKEQELNVQFTGRLPYPEMCGRLSACDISVNPIVPGAAGSIINKHGDYAACGRPVVSTQECQEYRDLVDEYRMGFNCACGDAASLADALEQLIQNPTLRKEMGENARRCAEERFDREHSYQKIVELITR